MALPILAAAGPMAASAGMGAAGGAGMASWLGPMLGAGIAGGSGIFGGILQGGQNQASARAQMAFQERMYRHRYRYTMQDLRKAGLNPILASEVGGGGTPSGAGYQSPNIMESVSNSARALAMDMANFNLIRSQTLESKARAAQSAASAREIGAKATMLEAEVPKAQLKEKVSTDIMGTLSDLYDAAKNKILGLELFKGAQGSSARDSKSKPDFGNVESGSSTEWFLSPRRKGENYSQPYGGSWR